MNYQLIIQFPLTDASADVFDRLLAIEGELELGFLGKHRVDGHEIGLKEFNIFIHTNHPDQAFEVVENILSENDLNGILAAYRDISSDEYVVIWPRNYSGVFKV